MTNRTGYSTIGDTAIDGVMAQALGRDWRSVTEAVRRGVEIHYDWHERKIYDWRLRCFRRVRVADAAGRLHNERVPGIMGEEKLYKRRFELIAEHIYEHGPMTYDDIMAVCGYKTTTTVSNYMRLYPDVFHVAKVPGLKKPALVTLEDGWQDAVNRHVESQERNQRRGACRKNEYLAQIAEFLQQHGGWVTREQIMEATGCATKAVAKNVAKLPVEDRMVWANDYAKRKEYRWAGG